MLRGLTFAVAIAVTVIGTALAPAGRANAAFRSQQVIANGGIPIITPQLPRLARASEQVTTFASELGEMTKRNPVGSTVPRRCPSRHQWYQLSAALL